MNETARTAEDARREWEARNGHLRATEGALPVRVNGTENPPQPKPKKPRARWEGSQYAMVMEAAKDIGNPFTLSQLTVLVWQNHMGVFGLPGFAADYPSDRKVYLTLVGKRGLVARGLLRKLPGGLYEVVKEEP